MGSVEMNMVGHVQTYPSPTHAHIQAVTAGNCFFLISTYHYAPEIQAVHVGQRFECNLFHIVDFNAYLFSHFRETVGDTTGVSVTVCREM